MDWMTMYLYQQNKRYFAQYATGFEGVAQKELAGLGAGSIEPEGNGARFTADALTLYRINYMSRVLTRILAPLVAFDCQDPDQLYRNAKAIDWAGIFDPGRSFAVFANVRQSAITHSQFAALRLKDAIVDRFRETGRKRPNVDRHSPDCSFNLYIHRDRAVISLDTSGGSLHRRGYRKETVEAPLQETLAAAILGLAEWDGACKVYDPMCGSGTLITEALMHYCRIPAGYLRQRFGFQRLPDFNPIAWRALKNEMDRRIRPLPPGLIAGSDLSPQAVNAAKTNIGLLPFARRVPIQVSDFRRITRLDQALVICNPPYGIRLEKDRDLSGFYQTLGDFLKQRCRNSNAYIYFGDRDYIKSIGLKPAWKKPLSNGGLDGRLVKYELY